MTERDIIFNGTIFDYQAWGKFFNSPSPDKKRSQFMFIYYFLSVVLQIISLSYLFNHKSTEYLVYVFTFIIYCVSPFLWIQDLHNFGSSIEKGRYKNLFKYKEVSLGISFLFTFLGILLVILTNENIRKHKIGIHKKKEDKGFWDLFEYERDDTDKSYKSEINSLKTKDKLRERNNNSILILYATLLSSQWGLIGEAFCRSNSFGKQDNPELYSSGFTETLAWLLDQPYITLNNLDKKIHNYTDKLNVTPLLKSFSLYCVTFISMFFGLFIRLPKGFTKIRDESNNGEDKTGNKRGLARKQADAEERYRQVKIINMGNLFTPKFYRNLTDHKNTTLFFFSFILCILAFIIMNVTIPFTGGFSFKTTIKEHAGKTGFITLLSSIIALIFGLCFGLRDKVTTYTIENMVMLLISVVFALFGTPVILAILQLLLESGIIGIIFGGFSNFFIKVINKIMLSFGRNLNDLHFLTIPRTLNYNGYFGWAAGFSFLALFLSMFGLGATKWTPSSGINVYIDENGNRKIDRNEHDDKGIRLFNAVLVTMAVSLFISLTPNYNMFTNLYQFIKIILELLLVYIVPIGSIGMALALFILSYKNHHKKIYQTDG